MSHNPIVLRKYGGRLDAAWLFRRTSATTAPHSQTRHAALVFGLIALVAIVLLAVIGLALMHPAVAHASPWAGLAVGQIVAKDGRANEFRVRAQALRDELLDASKTFTKDEVLQKSEEIKALEARAAMVAEFTPEAEIDRQGGDEELKRSAPDHEEQDVSARDFQKRMDTLMKQVRNVFGGPNGYLLRVAQRSVQPLTAKEQRIHADIQELAKRSTIIGTTGDDRGGEFLLPLQQVSSIFSIDNTQMGLAQYATRYPVSGRTLRIPYLVQDEMKDSAGNLINRPMAGIANVGIIGEGASATEAEPRFKQRLLTVFKVAAYTEISDEMLTDDFTGELSPTVQKAIGGQIMNFINEQVTIDGDNNSKPLGALNAANNARVLVERHTKGTITTDDVFNMFAAHTFGGGQSFWLVHRSALPKVLALNLNGNSLVTFLRDLQGAPQMTLMGLPIVITDLTQPLGSVGDIALLNGGFYALAIRQALTVESSIHYKFRNDVTAMRFLGRFGGIPIPTDTYAYKTGTYTETHTGAKRPAAKIAAHSPFTVLDHTAYAS